MTEFFMKMRVWNLLVIFGGFGLAWSILMGEYALDEDFPYAVNIFFKSEGYCSGLIATFSYVFTACHCLGRFYKKKFKPHHLKNFRIHAGTAWSSMISVNDENLQVRYAVLGIIHPNCSDRYWTWLYDYGLLRVNSPFQETGKLKVFRPRYLNPETLSTSVDKLVNDGSVCRAAGWGMKGTSFQGYHVNISERLKYVPVRLTSAAECAKALCKEPKSVCEDPSSWLYTKLCAVSNETAMGSLCSRDDGGPLVCDGYVYGIHLNGPSCKSRYAKPRIFGRLDYAASFLRSIIG